MPNHECRYCDKRTADCNSSCNSYKAYRAAKDEQNYKKWMEHKEKAEVKRTRRKNILSTHKVRTYEI